MKYLQVHTYYLEMPTHQEGDPIEYCSAWTVREFKRLLFRVWELES